MASLTDDEVIPVKLLYLDTGMVIEEVKKQRVIWDKTCSGYKNKSERKAAWRTVCQALYENYDELKPTDQFEVDIKIQGRWKTARDAYTKNKTALGRKRKPYFYSESLSFLDEPHVQSLSDNDDNRIPANQIKSEEPNIEIDVNSEITYEYDQSNVIPQQFEKYIQHVKEDCEDEDMSFFRSLKSSIEGFTPRQKIMFRSMVLQSILKVQEQHDLSDQVVSSVTML